METVLSIHAGTTDVYTQTPSYDLHLALYTKLTQNTVELNVKSKITKLLRENICAFMLGKGLFLYDTKSTVYKR